MKYPKDDIDVLSGSPLWRAIDRAIFEFIEENCCAADEGQNYDKSDGFYVSGTHEAAHHISINLYRIIKEAWNDGWRVRDQSCGRNKMQIIGKKGVDRDKYFQTLINDFNERDWPFEGEHGMYHKEQEDKRSVATKMIDK